MGAHLGQWRRESANRRHPRLDRLGRHPGAGADRPEPGPVPGARALGRRRQRRRCSPSRRSSSVSRWSRWRRPRSPRTCSSRSTPRRSGRGTRRASSGSPRSSPARTRPASSRRCRVTWFSTASPARSGCSRRWPRSTPGTRSPWPTRSRWSIGGPLVTRRVKPGQIVPVDSEHSAIAQCLRGGSADEVRKLLLTASGGPFLGRPRRRAGRRHGRAGAGPPELRDGPGRHDQLRHPGEQGAGADRGAPAVRASRWTGSMSSSTRSGDALDGRVLRRLDAWRRPRRRRCGCRSRSASAGPTGFRTRRRRVTGPRRAPGSSSRSTTRRSRRSSWPARPGRRGGTAPAVFNAANEVCVAGVPGRAAAVPGDRRHRGPGGDRTRRTLV